MQNFPGVESCRISSQSPGAAGSRAWCTEIDSLLPYFSFIEKLQLQVLPGVRYKTRSSCQREAHSCGDAAGFSTSVVAQYPIVFHTSLSLCMSVPGIWASSEMLGGFNYVDCV